MRHPVSLYNIIISDTARQFNLTPMPRIWHLARMSKLGWQIAVDAAAKKKGTLTAVARALGITRQAIHMWPEIGPPARHVIPLEEMSGVSRHQIRPDLFGADPSLVGDEAGSSRHAA